MEIDPVLRMTAEEALKHPWITRNEKKAMLKENEDILDSLINGSQSANNKKKNAIKL